MSKKIKVCYLISMLGNEGPINVMHNIIRYMDFERFDVSIMTFVPEKPSSRLKEFEEFPIRIIQLEPEKFLNPLALFLKFKAAVKKEAPDILHSHCPRSLFLLGMISTKAKKSYTVHVYPGLQQQVLYGPLAGRVVIGLSKFFIKKMHLPIACSQNVSDDFKTVDHLNVKAIPNGGAFEPTVVSAQQKAEMRQKLGLKPDVTYFIYIGRLSKEKNPEFIAQMFQSMADQKLGLIILGEGVLKEALQAYQIPNLVLPGFVKNVNDYILASDFNISSSLIEGLANSLLETMAMGVPYLLSDIPSHLAVHKEAKRFAGAIFKNNDEADFKAKLKELMNFPYQDASNNVRNCYAENYTAEKMSKEYQNSYQNIIK